MTDERVEKVRAGLVLAQWEREDHLPTCDQNWGGCSCERAPWQALDSLERELEEGKNELGEAIDRAAVHYGEVVHTLESQLSAARQVVEALAAMRPFDKDWDGCRFCHGGTDWPPDTPEHYDGCVWVQARALSLSNEVTG